MQLSTSCRCTNIKKRSEKQRLYQEDRKEYIKTWFYFMSHIKSKIPKRSLMLEKHHLHKRLKNSQATLNERNDEQYIAKTVPKWLHPPKTLAKPSVGFWACWETKVGTETRQPDFSKRCFEADAWNLCTFTSMKLSKKNWILEPQPKSNKSGAPRLEGFLVCSAFILA